MADLILLCPRCGETLNAHDNLEDHTAKPSAGDHGVCAYCISVHVYEPGANGHLTPRMIAKEDMDKLEPEHVRSLAKAIYVATMMRPFMLSERATKAMAKKEGAS